MSTIRATDTDALNGPMSAIPGALSDQSALSRFRSSHALPAGFEFGVATAAYQIEGGASAGGRTPSIWDVFAAVPGTIADGSSGADAVDHFHRWTADLALLADLGVGAYRFSLSWSRMQPHGSGPASSDGIAFYDRLVDGLLAAGIRPFVALYHWDLPLELMEHGGWLVRETAERFADYTAVAVSALRDRVAAWTTVDEPLLHMAYGHAVGIDAPGLTLLGGAFQVTHHQLLAHARAVQVLRSETDASVGIVNHHTTVDPASPGRSDIAAAACYDAYHNRQFADPVLRGRYPDEILRMPGVADDVIFDGDLDAISAPLDFYGVTFHHATVVAAAPGNSSVPFTLTDMPGVPLTASGWPVRSQSLTRVLTELTAEYPSLPPLYVAANGCAYADVTAGDGRSVLPDAERIAYLDGHLAAVADAVAGGCDVRGYFYSSLLDGWEWSDGFTRRFGLVRVDPETLDRHPRASFVHYRELIERGRAVR